MTGGKCAETEKSLKRRVGASVLNCGAGMTSGGGNRCDGDGDENVTLQRCDLKSFSLSTKGRALEQTPPPAWIYRRGIRLSYSRRPVWLRLTRQGPTCSASVLQAAARHINSGGNGFFYSGGLRRLRWRSDTIGASAVKLPVVK